MSNKRFRNNLINGLAIVSLFIAFYIGEAHSNRIKELSETNIFREYNITKVVENDKIFTAYSNNKKIGYLSTGSSQGYGGPLDILLLSDTVGTVSDIDLIHSTETYAYLSKLRSKCYFQQYKNKKANDRYIPDKDIVAVSGATISSNAIALASREAAWKIADKLSAPIPEIVKEWEIGIREILILIIFLMAAVYCFTKKKILRYITFGLSIIILGFLYNASISLSHFGRIFLGYLPDIRVHFIWWLLLFGNILFIIIAGKNIYCSAACPFHAVQLFANKISGINFKIAPKLSRYLINTPKFLLWFSLMLIFISKNPTISSYEPFSMIFSLEGIGIQWYILPISLMGSLFMSSFFCNYFCPVGAGFRILLSYRKRVVNIIKSKYEKN